MTPLVHVGFANCRPGDAAWIARVLFFLFLIVFVVSLIAPGAPGRAAPGSAMGGTSGAGSGP